MAREQIERTQIAVSSLKTMRTNTGNIAPGFHSIDVNWTEAFADTDYTVTASVIHSTGAIRFVGITAKTVAKITVLVENVIGGSTNADINAIAIHD